MSKNASALLVSRLDALPGVMERLGILANVRVEPQREGLEQSYTHWNVLKQSFARGLPFGPKLATAEAVCRWTKEQEGKLELAHQVMDEREDEDWYPEFPVTGVVACAAVHQDTRLLQRMFTERVLQLDGSSNAVFAILCVAGLLRAPKLVEMLQEWESVSVELFDVGEWKGLLRSALWTADQEWAGRCRAMIDNRLDGQEYGDVEKEAEAFGAGPGDIIRLWHSNHSFKA